MSAALELTANEPQQIGLLNLPVGSVATEVGLKLPKMKFEKWEQLTADLITTEGSSQWLIGDSLLYGRQTYGEDYAQVIDVQKLRRTDESTIRGYLWVSESVPVFLRRTNLRWYHHKEVARLSHEEQAAWLERAETLKWTVRELRSHIKEIQDESDAADVETSSDLDVLQDPLVRQFFTDHIEMLKARLDVIPPNAPFAHNLVHGQIGQAQWQLDRTEKEEAVKVLEAIDEGWQIGTEIFNWLQKRSFFMREPELKHRLVAMCDLKRLREVKQGGRKDNQRGDLTSMYVRYDAMTGDAFTVSKGSSLYDSGDED